MPMTMRQHILTKQLVRLGRTWHLHPHQLLVGMNALENSKAVSHQH